MEIDPRTGLPVEAMAWEDLAKSEQKIQISSVKRKFGKIMTIVSGFENGMDLKKIAKQLKAELGCGGTVKDREIELQGNHKKKVIPLLVELGFERDSINA
ncbi:stress response translation initiation inhibitor YciH [Candidatus Pacearchaeota archaeon]|jgi:translation initiation factor 1|nr:stress response translation initiation inhibitor YciH [Candidatus Pacearchaeota archaeon]|tara:strand:- start:3904 stop:4203 length:300 start_codon:yes stop_codon:yes gene_type:complete